MAHKFGTLIVANGDEFGFVVEDRGDKALCIVQEAGNNSPQWASLGWREPADYDEKGAGGTYKLK